MTTQTDRELLELAAKAAGYKSCGMYEDGRIYLLGIQAPWSPLTCDGDALRLAVKLGLLIDARYTDPMAQKYNEVLYWKTPTTVERMAFDDVELSAAAATRRAIVRAAAEIGKAMP